MKKKHSFLAALMALLLMPGAAQADKLRVVASFSILGDMTIRVGGDAIDLTTLVGADGDAHVYEPTPANAASIAGADVIILNGLGYEGWLERLMQSTGYKGVAVVASDGIIVRAGDPHAWQSLANAKIYVANIAAALVRADSAHAAQYRANAAAYTAELTALDSWARGQLATVPEGARRVITSHDSFGYFARDYGVHFIAAQGISTGGDASARDIARLIDQLRSQKLHALFIENISDARLIRQLERDAGAKIGGTLYSDALSPPSGPAGNYLAMFRHNVAQLVSAMKQDIHE